jgi:hypothetical protein
MVGMFTLYSEIYTAALGKITDPFYSSSIAEADLRLLLQTAMVKFPYPDCDLSNRDEDNKRFLFKLTDLEVEILASLITLEWANRAILDIDTIRPSYTTVEFRQSSPGYHLRALEKVLGTLKGELNELIDRYAKSAGTNSPIRLADWGAGGGGSTD